MLKTDITVLASNYITIYSTGTKNNIGFDYDTENDNPATATKMWFTSIKDQYNANSTTTDIPQILSKLDKQNIYHKWMNTSANQTKNYNNEKAVASMLDVDLWNGYNNTTYAKYVLGGPTIEMFCRAYNDSHTGDKLEINEEYGSGYKIKKESEENYHDAVSGLKTGSKNNIVDSIYFKFGYSCWIASPHNGFGYTSYMLSIFSDGGIGYKKYVDASSFRPLVCLNSDVHLVEKVNGSITTYELELD